MPSLTLRPAGNGWRLVIMTPGHHGRGDTAPHRSSLEGRDETANGHTEG